MNVLVKAPHALRSIPANEEPKSKRSLGNLRMVRKVLLVCGILSSLLYVATDIFAALQYAGYSYAAQGVSELNAVGAPTRPLTLPLFTLDDVLLLAFGVAVLALAGRNRALRLTGAPSSRLPPSPRGGRAVMGRPGSGAGSRSSNNTDMGTFYWGDRR